MTVTEARISGLPIILSPFPTAPSVMMEKGQYLLNGMEPKDILEGLQAFAAGEVPHDYHFDVEEYNRKCLHEWNRLLDYAPRKSS